MTDPIPTLNDDPGAPPEVLEVRVPGLKGVQLRIEVDRFVWEWFDAMRLAVGVYQDGVRTTTATPLDQFRKYIEDRVRVMFARAIELGAPVDKAAADAGREGGSYVAPIQFARLVLEGAAQVPSAAAAAHQMLVRYLARRPVQLAAVQEGLTDNDEFPPQLRPAVRRVVIAAEAEARRN